jgi:hypothetical protein
MPMPQSAEPNPQADADRLEPIRPSPLAVVMRAMQ